MSLLSGWNQKVCRKKIVSNLEVSCYGLFIIEQWLKSILIFADAGISGRLFMNLTKERLEDYGVKISPVGFDTIKELQKEMNPTPGGSYD